MINPKGIRDAFALAANCKDAIATLRAVRAMSALPPITDIRQ
jgi:hypothetical protein